MIRPTPAVTRSYTRAPHPTLFRAARLHRRAINTQEARALAADRAKDRGIAQRGCRIDRDDDATAVAFVDAHAQATDADDAAKPVVLLERGVAGRLHQRSEEHTSELQSLLRTSYHVF